MPLTSWVDVPDGSPFPVQNLPYGVVTHAGGHPGGGRRHLAVAIGDDVLCLSELAARGLLDGAVPVPEVVAAAESLNPVLALGSPRWHSLRARLTELLTVPGRRGQVEPALSPRRDAAVHLPMEVADYVDFYSSQHHAENVGAIFRPDDPALPPNWRWLPIGYHGRAGTVVVSGTPVVRPHGQRRPRGAVLPSFGPSTRLDIEAEVGFLVGTPSPLGTPVPAGAFADHVFGALLLNDWSARDIQAWEYQPLGPFLGKSFATSVSPWVVPLEALEPARVAPPAQDPPVFDYLRDDDPWALDLHLEIRLNRALVSTPPFRTMYWTPGQQLAHLTVNGASLRTGDLYASGTVTGPERGQRGSLLELSWGGAEPFGLGDGTSRTFLEDGDEVAISGWATGADGVPIGFGEVAGTVLPAHDLPAGGQR